MPKLSTREVLILGICAVAILIGVSLGLYAPRVLAQDKSPIAGLDPIAEITDEQSRVRRRFGKDLLWLPISVGDSIYYSDRIATLSSSRAELRFVDGNVVTILENSLIYITKIGDTFCINVASGEVEVSKVSPASILVRRANQLERAKAPDLAVPTKQNNKISASPTPDDEHSDSPSEDPPHFEQRFQYPANGTLILYKSSRSLRLIPRNFCINDCQLNLVRGSTQIATREFRAGEPPSYEIEINSETEGDYSLEFIDGKVKITIYFAMRRFTQERLVQAIQNDTPVDVLE